VRGIVRILKAFLLGLMIPLNVLADSSITLTSYSPLMWYYYPISISATEDFSETNGIEVAQTNGSTLIRHENDFVSHMNEMPIIGLKNKKYLYAYINRYAKHPNRNLKSKYLIFNVLYYSDFYETFSEKPYVLTKLEKMNWVKDNLRHNLPLVPFMLYISVLEENLNESSAWYLAARQIMSDDVKRCKDVSASAAIDAMYTWWSKEMTERFLIYQSEKVKKILERRGVEVLLSAYGLNTSAIGIDMESLSEQHSSEKIFQAILDRFSYFLNTMPDFNAETDDYRVIYNMIHQTYADNYQNNKAEIDQRTDELIKQYYKYQTPYWAAYHGMAVISNPNIGEDELFIEPKY